MILNSKASLRDTELPIQYQTFTPLMYTTYLQQPDVVLLPTPSKKLSYLTTE